jgi:hypothetical protein
VEVRTYKNQGRDDGMLDELSSGHFSMGVVARGSGKASDSLSCTKSPDIRSRLVHQVVISHREQGCASERVRGS